MRVWVISCVGAVDRARQVESWRLVSPLVWVVVAAWVLLAVWWLAAT